jgi:hypothetical protein
MDTPRLNLDLLRRAATLRRRQPASTRPEIERGGCLEVSRRGFFGVAGVATVDLSPLLRRLEAFSLGAVEVTSSADRIAFALGGRERWVIDSGRFAGRPRLRLSRGPGRVDVALVDALLPGTPLPADLDCSLEEGLLGWRMRLRLALGGFEAEAPFEAWLLGRERAAAILDPKAAGCLELARGLSLTLGRSLAAFTPDWALQCEGAGAAAVHGDGVEIPSASAEIAVLGAGGATLFAGTAGKRTLVSLARAGGTWVVGGLHPAPDRGRFVGAAPFDLVQIELGEEPGSGRRAALVATGADGGGTLAFEPAPALVAPGGEPFRLPLSSPRLAAAYEGGGSEQALVAEFSSHPVWLDAGGSRIEVGRIRGGPPFELVSGDGGSRLCCEPGLLAVSSPLGGAVSGKARPRKGTLVAFAGDPEALAALAAEPQTVPPQTRQVKPVTRVAPTPTPTPAAAPGAPAVRPAVSQAAPVKAPSAAPQPQAAPAVRAPVAPERAVVQMVPGGVGLRLPAHLRLPVIRPDDFLFFELELDNLRIEAGAPPHLVRADAAKPARLIVHFPPQNIAEQAFFETATGYPVSKPGDSSAPPDPDVGTATSQTPGPPPVRARIAGWSRLAFTVPPAALPLDYTLPALLDACGALPLAVPPTALPPDKPKKLLPPKREALVARPVGAAPGAARPAAAAKPVAAVALQSGAAAAGKVARPVVSAQTARLRAAAQAPVVSAVMRPEGIAGTLLQVLRPREPEAGETAIEAPYRLLISPHAGAAWAHATGLVRGASGRVELWHTRLAVRAADGSADENDEDDRTVRAVWSPDYRLDNPPAHYGAAQTATDDNPFRMPLDARDRHEIVPLTSDFTIPSYRPKPVAVQRLMLSALGAWMNVRGAWEPPFDPRQKSGQGLQLEVEEWRHRATMGRDHYVRVVYKGYLFPFGHRASLIKVTERKFRPIADGPQRGQIAAYLFQRMYLVVREPERDYAAVDFVNAAGEHYEYANPFKRVRITTLITPDLDPPENSDVADKAQQAFWPSVGTRPFRFHLIAHDWEGRASELTAPLIFVGAAFAHGEDGVLAAAKADFAKTDTPEHAERRQRPFAGQKVAFAEAAPAKPGGTALEVADVTFGVEIPPADTPRETPRFYPTVTGAAVKMPAVQAISGGNQAPRIRFSPVYLKNGFGGAANKAELWAELEEMSPLRMGADKAGGIATPNMDIAGISRISGPVGGSSNPGPEGLEKFATGAFDPKEFFGAAGAKILGGIGLADIIESVLSGGDGKNVPKLTTTVLYPGGDESQLPDGVEANLDWKPTVKSDPLGLFKPSAGSVFQLQAKVTSRLAASGQPQAPEYLVHGELTNFKIDLIAPVTSFLIVEFEKFTLDAGSGRKTDVVPKIRSVEFAGPLAFVNELKEFLKGYGFEIDLSGGGVTAGYTLPIPAITAGVMSLENISVSAAITIPFTGDPVRLRFAFCSRENPFLLRVYCFGGGGFVGLSLGIDGVELLELSFEFGACMSLDIGVASGGVYAMAGIYIKMENDAASLTGYLRLGGSLSVLAIITLSLEFYMGLTYETAGNKVWGEARLTVEIEILFFSASVEMSVRREFVDPEIPKFADMMTAGEWQQYCEAFA